MDTSSQNAQAAFKLENQSHKLGGAKIWALVFDLPGEKVNKFTRPVMQELEALLPKLQEMAKGKEMEALVLVSRKTGNFIAGADIELIKAANTVDEAFELSRAGQRIVDAWEDLECPTVVAISGATLGGGCELSLASTAIVMSNDPAAKIGLPEVLLGVIPGMGGCVRLPKKVGLATALDLILTGKTLDGERAYRAGLAEACLPKENFEEFALKWAKENLSALKAGKRLGKEPKLGGVGGTMGLLIEKTPFGRRMVLKKAKDGVLEKTKGHYPAPLEALAVVDETGGAYGPKLRGSSREAAMVREAKGFAKVATTEISKNLIRIFFLTEGVKKSKGLLVGVEAPARPIKIAGVLGAGVMGGGIAQLFADKGISVRMKDIGNNALSLGVQSALNIFKKQVHQRRLTQRQLTQKLNLIVPVLGYEGFGSLDLVVEAVIENMEIKRKLFEELESQVRQDCIIASNTSSLSISKMQEGLKNPERFVGVHFFNPVHKMPLVEVIRGSKTSDEVVTSTFQFCKQMGKTPVVVKDAPGFLVNRLLMPYLNEATYLVADGVPFDEIDRVLVAFGMPMGPIELIDEVGVDVGEKVAHILHDAFGARALPSPINAKIVLAGRVGKKKGEGFYRYEGPKKEKTADAKAYEILGITPSKGILKGEEILERCILPMVNEAARCLEEGIVASAAELDLAMIMGMGFPPFRGGLMRYADSLSATNIVEGLKKYEVRFGARFEPAPAMIKRAEFGQKFYPS